MDAVAIASRKASASRIRAALGADSARPNAGMLDRLFTMAFTGLVYPQIWEDPEADLDALEIEPDNHLVTISSGGCNVMSYLSAAPCKITAVDLNPAHIALTRLKLAAARNLPDYAAFRRFFAEPRQPDNIAAFDRCLDRALDPATRSYWQRRRLGRRRIAAFSGNFYTKGLLGRFIGAAHKVARLYGIDPRIMLTAGDRDQQIEIFDAQIAPLFDRRFLRWLTGRTISLYGLGIPPAQYSALAGDRHMADVLRDRLRRLACDFDLSDNYFAHQAFGRRYSTDADEALPLYLRQSRFGALRARAEEVSVLHRSMTDFLADQPPESVDRVVLLDAQDWMSDEQLNALWYEITRTARPGARVIFRTAAEPDLLPGRVDDDILGRWRYDAETSAAVHERDRSAIYGGFHLYRLRGLDA